MFSAFNDALRAVIINARNGAQADLAPRIGGRTGCLIRGEPPDSTDVNEAGFT